MEALWAAISLILLYSLGSSTFNAFRFPRLRPVLPGPMPTVSILIPARNEEGYIGRAVRNALVQGATEVIVLDDCSSDATANRAVSAGSHDARFRLMRNQDLPEGWTGKNWACHELARAATGEVLCFTDADVEWRPGALRALLATREIHGARAITAWPTYQTEAIAEKLTVPLIAFAIYGFLPEPFVRHSPYLAHVAGSGQCFVVDRRVYDASGGHEASRTTVLDDVALARNIKATGHPLVLADGAGLLRGRMYRGWEAVREGFAKNVLAGHGDHIALLMLAMVLYWTVFLGPWFWLVIGSAFGAGWPWWPLAMIISAILTRAVTARSTRQQARYALLFPISVLLMTTISVRAIFWRFRYGSPRWKGRTLPRADVASERVVDVSERRVDLPV